MLNKRIVALVFALFVCTAQAQQDPDLALRTKYLEEATAVINSNSQLPRAEVRAKLDEYLSTIPVQFAGLVEFDLVEGALTAGYLTQSNYAREKLRIVRRYMSDSSDGDLYRDLWGYVVVIASKLERKEIPLEEYEYLYERKRSEITKELKLRSAEQSNRREEAERQLSRAREQQQANEEAERRQWEVDRARILNDTLQRALQPLRPRPTTTCRTMRVGAQIQTVCN